MRDSFSLFKSAHANFHCTSSWTHCEFARPFKHRWSRQVDEGCHQGAIRWAVLIGQAGAFIRTPPLVIGGASAGRPWAESELSFQTSAPLS